MDELILSNGQKITFDLSKVSHRIYAAFWNEKATSEEKDVFFSAVCGLTEKQIDEFAEPDWRAFKQKLFDVCFKPLDEQEKNSQSASI